MNYRKKAKARITKWKKALKKGHEIAKMTGVTESTISRIFNDSGDVSDDQCRKVLDAKE